MVTGMSRNQQDAAARKRHRERKIAQVQRERDIAEVFGVYSMQEYLSYAVSNAHKYDNPPGFESHLRETLDRYEKSIIIDGTRNFEYVHKEEDIEFIQKTNYGESMYAVYGWGGLILNLPFENTAIEYKGVCGLCDSGATGERDWSVMLYDFEEDNIDYPKPLLSFNIDVISYDKIEFTGKTGVIRYSPEDNALVLSTNEKQSNLDMLVNFAFQAFRIITLLNTNNIELIDQPPNPRLSAISEREFGRPLTTYKVLKVNTGHKEYRGQDANTGLKDFDPRRMHVVRGHHAEYGTNGRKLLFGKYERKIWIPAHVRGNEERGIVVKDYEVVNHD